METSSHRIRIRKRPDQVYEALATVDGLKNWFAPDIRGEVAPGGVAVFHHPGRDSFRWKFVEMAPGALSRWECEEGPGAAAGTRVTFRLSPDGDTTVVECDHEAWPEGHAAFKSCNTLWGVLMGRLRDYVETARPQPALT